MQEHIAKQLVLALAGCTRALITSFGMMAENQYRMNCGNQIAYDEEAFLKLIEENGLTHNQAVTNILQI
jgi:hypothetical protein